MQVKLESQSPVTDQAAKAATGKTLKEWFAALDERGGPAQGRRAINDWLFGECKIDPWWCSTINIEYEGAKGVVEKDKRPKGYTICATKTITAPLELVYRAWADPLQLDKWFGTKSNAEVSDGGTFSNADGDKGTYKRVRANKDLRFLWEGAAYTPGSIVDVVFQDKGKGKTYVQITHDRIQTRAEADGLRNGWGEALDKLKALLEH